MKEKLQQFITLTVNRRNMRYPWETTGGICPSLKPWPTH